MRTFKITIAYDGTDFAGWQWQPRQRTVQEELEKAIARITQEKVRCVASGRTDSGVHALGQVVGFTCGTWLTSAMLLKALNAELPDDIIVFDIAEVPAGFHPIRDAVRKRYRYVIQDGRPRDIFVRNYVWHLRKRLDVEAMRQGAAALIGTHDFESYQTHGSSRLTTERTVYDLLVERRPGELTDRVIVEVEADGFLYNMVRVIVGTLVEVGKGTQPTTWPAEVLAAKDRRAAGVTAPAQGLFMLWVEYGDLTAESAGQGSGAVIHDRDLSEAECIDEDEEGLE